ncbi:hypothetical protein D3C85_1469710 [compost metagenome]
MPLLSSGTGVCKSTPLFLKVTVPVGLKLGFDVFVTCAVRVVVSPTEIPPDEDRVVDVLALLTVCPTAADELNA